MNVTGMVKLALDLKRGVQTFNYEDKTYNRGEAVEVLRQALIDANGGSTTIDRKTLRRNKAQIYELIEQLTDAMIHEGLQGNEFWMNYVDYVNVALGDKNEFIAKDNSLFIVSEIADGIATPRRQRIGKSTAMTVGTSLHAIRMYDEYTRFMAGRIDWNDLVDRVSKSFDLEMWNDIYVAFNGINKDTVGLSETYVYTGTFSAEKLLEMIEHVEAATGESAVLIGTKKGLSKCESSHMCEEAKNNMFKNGFFGIFNGTPMVALKQIHKTGTDEFMLDDNTIYIVAGGEHFIKFVEEGEAYIDDRDVTRYNDKTIEYFIEKRWGVALMIAGKIGKYTFA